MARQDIANMLTGMGGGSTRPNPNMSSSDWRMAFGAQQAQGLMNAARTTTPQEAIQMGIGKLDLGTVKGLQTLGQMQQIRGDTEAAAKTASQIEAMQTATESSKSNVDSRANVAAQLTATHPLLATAIMKEAPSGNDKILVAGLRILEEKSKTVKPVAPNIVNLIDTATNKTIGSGTVKNNQYYPIGSDVPLTAIEMQGMGLSASVVQPSKSLVNIGDDLEAKRHVKKLEEQSTQMIVTPEDAAAAIDLAANNRRVLAKVDSGMNTGVASEFLGEQAQNVQSVFQAAGLPVPQFIAGKAWERAELTAMQNEAMIPFIAMQGKGWTDADRVNYYRTSAGFTQPWQYNEAVATMKLQNAIDTIERSQFSTTRGQLDELTDLNSTTLWNDYLKQVPRTTVDKDFERNGLKYDRTRVIDDNANLSQYWVEDKPTGFTIKDLKKGNRTVGWAEIKQLATNRNKSVRGFLAQLDNRGLIVGATY